MSDNSSKEKSVRSASYAAEYESLSDVRDFVAGCAEVCGLKEKAVYAVQLAVDEAFTNIIEHAYGGESKENIRCTCQINEDDLTIVLQDCGRPFDPEDIPDPNLEAELQERDAGGLGLFFMRQLMDEVHFTFDVDLEKSEKCNILTMVKRKEKAV